MSIPDLDGEPVVRRRTVIVVLGVVSALAGLLAVVGWPLPVISSTHGSAGPHAWARTVRGVQDWFAYDGWRMSGSSWVYGALATATAASIAVIRHPAWSGGTAVVVVVAPAGAMLLVGPVAQWSLGLPWSNYGVGSTSAVAFGGVATVAGGAALFAVRRTLRRRGRRGDRAD
ncbi:hypothetical protein [Curtobacterium sp. VKM Ac-2922]|uniref:hypothetical protein n=1 Tax=Curtobacterium sp. VKM Ac-2922 TaxID=2929475 RepID=UPI001FB399AE|nr:hypothetical protein [Curtobacterium sp. VKM Ac-2922]MCJ1712687.1 hypothetical protein [Curtobacterium sp. VKM Ac-2922]